MPWPSLTDPFTWVAGQLVTALRMNQEIRDRLNHLKGGCYQTERFRNLKLRTAGANVEATTVWLERADEIVMDDGTRVGPWENLTAAITVSGAGGLDTGSELSSTWYAIQAIRKTSDGTKNLLLSRATFWTADVSHQTHDGVHDLFTGATTNVRLAQSWQPSTTGPLQHVEVLLIKTGSPTSTFYFTIEADSSGAPSGTPLATSQRFFMADVPTVTTVIRIPFVPMPSLTASTTYWLVLRTDQGGADATNRIGWRADTTAAAYSGGAKAAYNGTTWTTDTDDDFWFVTAVQFVITPTMPSGYDQKALIGFVYNNGSSNFDAFLAHNRRVMWMVQKAPVSGGASTTPAVISITDAMPPRPCLVEFGLINNTSAAVSIVGPVPGGFGITASSVGLRGGRQMNNPSGANSGFGPPHGALLTDLQSFYYLVNAGSLTAYVAGYEWF